jgi:hypothetical protein
MCIFAAWRIFSQLIVNYHLIKLQYLLQTYLRILVWHSCDYLWILKTTEVNLRGEDFSGIGGSEEKRERQNQFLLKQWV